jgi:ATP-binding cassette subfamily F protein 3
MIQIKDICLDFGSQKVFDHLSMNVNQDQRIGLVGRNGMGKSTLLKAIDKIQPLDRGTINITNKMNVAYMPQEMVLASSKTILEEALSSYKDVGALRERSLELEALIAANDTSVLEEYSEVSGRLAELNVEYAIAETKKMLLGLGFKLAQLDDPVSTLSVGWQMRVVLAKLLLQKADFYLFDEPTNHLDIVAKDWFLEFLKETDFGFMLVCHDKYFLDEMCNVILELDRGNGTIYYGNYTDYEEEKEARLQTLTQQAQLQQKDIDRKKKLIEQFKAKASKAKMAQSMQKMLDKEEIIKLPPDARTVRFTFPPTVRPGRIVLEVQNIGFGFENKKIFDNVSFQIERGDKVALVAPNGMGKTTLFNVLCGKYKPQHGKIEFGYNVKHTIFEQDQNRVLNPNKTVAEEVLDNCNKSEQECRSFLGAFLFGKDEIKKKTKVLSGGEKNRLSMVKVMLQDANFLLLDEPTNHLDISSKEILLKALQQFDGTILFVSHDHDFINKLSNRVIELTPTGVHSYHGNYDLFLQQKRDADRLLKKGGISDGADSANKNSSDKEDRKANHAAKKDQQRLEGKIARLEAEIRRLQNSFADIDYGTPEFDETDKALDAAQAELATVQKEWEKIAAQN